MQKKTGTSRPRLLARVLAEELYTVRGGVKGTETYSYCGTSGNATICDVD